jgi:XTP/dITP diphosphohydrolase
LENLTQIPPPPEDALTYEENAEIKAGYYSGHSEGLVFADDSGLEVEALGGAPGVRSARFAGENATGAENNELLLQSLKAVEKRNARFVTAIALARAGKVLITARGTVDGEILKAPRGQHGFGYDALFLYRPLNQSFAELADAQKFSFSARGNAFRSLLLWIADTLV